MEEREKIQNMLETFSTDTLKIALNFARQITEQTINMNPGVADKLTQNYANNEKIEYVDSGVVPIPEKTNILQKATSAAKAIVSKGLTGKKGSDLTKALRVLSCHGDNTFSACPYRENSVKYPNSFFCGACGCGDKNITQLVNRTENDGSIMYSKLDFPDIQCPLKMPGFRNYSETELDSEENKNSRKIYLENTRGIGYIKEHSYIKVEKNNENSRTESEQPNEQPNPNTENQQSND